MIEKTQLNAAAVNTITIFTGNSSGNVPFINIAVYVQPDGKIVFLPTGNNTAHNASKTYINADIDSEGNSQWFDVQIDVYENLTWSCAVNNTYLFTNKGPYYSDTEYSEIKLSRISLSDKFADSGSTYVSDIEVKNLLTLRVTFRKL